MKSIGHIVLKFFRKLHTLFFGHYNWRTDRFVELFNQQANDYIHYALNKAFNEKRGFMISKFGTVELDNIVCCLNSDKIIKLTKLDYIKGKVSLFKSDTIKVLCQNAGFFPNDVSLLDKYYNLTINDVKYIDILASYIENEKYINNFVNCKKVNLDGFYAPFMWDNPWTSFLRGKRVLVVHPFISTINEQYNKRDKLFDNSNVLPTFKELKLIKAVQSIGNNSENVPFNNWFEALSYMEEEIDKVEFDVAIVGCGAYGMNLAAYIKRKGKIAIHLAGWTQVLFGIYGNRWIVDQPQYKGYINKYWVRPSASEKPSSANKIEKGCYW